MGQQLEVLPPSMFPDRETVRQFVQGSEFDMLSGMVQCTLNARFGGGGGLPDHLYREIVSIGGWLHGDLMRLAQIAVSEDSQPPDLERSEERSPEEQVRCLMMLQWCIVFMDWHRIEEGCALLEGYRWRICDLDPQEPMEASHA